MARNGSGVYSLPSGLPSNGETSNATDDILTPFQDLETDMNTARPVVAGGTGASSASAARTNLGLAIGTNVQAYDAALTSIAALGTAADKGVYATGVDTFAEFDLTAAGRELLDDADASAQRTTLGLGALATAANVTTAEIAAATLVTEADTIASNDNDTTIPTSAAVKNYVDSSALGSSYTSGAQTPTSGGLLTLAHGMGTVPKLIRIALEFTTAEAGFSIGDFVDVTASVERESSASASIGWVIYYDATNIYIRIGTSPNLILLPNKGTGTQDSVQVSSVDMHINAWA